MQTTYEWAVERVDLESGDILDTNHHDSLFSIPGPLAENERIVLVRDTGDQVQGLQRRLWAYPGIVVRADGPGWAMPDYFEDAGLTTSVKVPRRFARDWMVYHHKLQPQAAAWQAGASVEG